MKKAANALFADAKPGFEIYLLPLAVGGVPGAIAFGAVLAAAKKLCGGSWVGGTVELLDNSLEFRPNAMNEFLHEGNYKVAIPYADIVRVHNEFGFISGIIRLELRHANFKVRVFGAKDFAEEIRARASSRARHET